MHGTSLQVVTTLRRGEGVLDVLAEAADEGEALLLEPPTGKGQGGQVETLSQDLQLTHGGELSDLIDAHGEEKAISSQNYELE